jgi:PLP dependent protein
MHKSVLNLNSVENEIKKIENNFNKAEIIAISKTFPITDILPLIEHGHTHFGENKIQEAIEKWSEIKKKKKNLRLHFVGNLQTNKVKFVIPLFDYIHSLDNFKLAAKIASQQIKINFKPKIFIQVNIGDEVQKNGVSVNELDSFIINCQKNLELDIIGLMCIPPNNNNTEKYFLEMKKLNKKFGFTELSMGMSDDYLLAINHSSTFVRIGTKIFGSRVK